LHGERKPKVAGLPGRISSDRIGHEFRSGVIADDARPAPGV
jgi:hypothetical protein